MASSKTRARLFQGETGQPILNVAERPSREGSHEIVEPGG